MRTKNEAIAALRADQQFWRDLADRVGPDRYAEPGPMGEWTFGDMAGHLVGWRNRTIRRLEAFAHDEPEPPNPWPAELDDDDDDDDSINDWIRAQHAGRAPAQLVADYDASYDRVIAAIESVSDAKLTDPEALPELGSALVDADFTDHLHEEHVPAVEAWLSEP
jgi:uncharacterized protein (TIGR03083 family)